MAFYSQRSWASRTAMGYILLITLIVGHTQLGSGAELGTWARTLQADLSWGNGRNWEGGRPPCPADRAIFRSESALTLALPAGATVLRALVLPATAELLLPATGSLRFTSQTRSPSCSGRDTVFVHTKPLRWLDPAIWDGWNAATPTLERPPCSTDAVRLPPAATLQMLMPPTLRLGQIQVNGKVMELYEWFMFMRDGWGKRQFQLEEGAGSPLLSVTFETCHREHWCACHNEYLRPLVCRYQCPEPLCERPVHPDGFCCPFCGAYMVLSGVRKQDVHALSAQLDRALPPEAGVVWHASALPDGLTQLVLADAGEYSGDIARAADTVKAFLVPSNSGLAVSESYASGPAWRPSPISQLIGRFFSLAVFAALALAAIVFFYSQDLRWVRLSGAPSSGRPFVFVRFVGDGEGDGEKEGEGGRVVVAGGPPNPEQSFDNPLYGNPATQQSMKRTTEEDISELSESAAVGQTFNNPMYGVAQEESSTVDSPGYRQVTETLSTTS